MGYEVLVPRYALPELAAARGRRVTLHTLAFMEGNPNTGNLIPRLVGFPRPEEKLFFSRFITVKGMGIRKVLKALGDKNNPDHWETWTSPVFTIDRP